MDHLWFWTFWHWSTENVRAGTLLRDPVRGIAGHWEEWFDHEASAAERAAVVAAGRSAQSQRAFLAWLVRCWAREARWQGEPPPVRFVLAQLARLAPFDGWAALARYRAGYGLGGVAAVVLAEKSTGDAADVRPVEAILLPADARTREPPVMPEGFAADAEQLQAARAAALDVLRGRGLLLALVTWVATGPRPYPPTLQTMLAAGWTAVAALVVYLVVGPDPGPALTVMATILAGSWAVLALTALTAAASVGLGAWRAGAQAAALLDRSQVRLWMPGGLSLFGRSAGVPFSLNAVLAAHRALPRTTRRSWFWRRVLAGASRRGAPCAATGAVHANGRIGRVVLGPKLVACLRHGGVDRLLTPAQRDAGRRTVARLADRLAGPPVPLQAPTLPVSLGAGAPIGVAAEYGKRLRTRQCRHLAHAVLAVGGLRSARQQAVNALALVTTVTLAVAAPDLRAILRPAPAPLVVAPTSTSPYELWVSLDTPHPEQFVVLLESSFWANRRAQVVPVAPGVPPRATLQLRRLSHAVTLNVDAGAVWVERRPRFLTRDFLAGERVGMYSLAYVRHPR